MVRARMQITKVVLLAVIAVGGRNNAWATGNGNRIRLQTISFAGRQVHQVDDVSDDFVRRARSACNSIPSPVWHSLAESGWKVWLTPFITDAVPGLRGMQPRGWPAGATWDHTDAAHLPNQKLLLFAENRRTITGEAVAAERVAGVLRHEFGHAFDVATRGSEECHSASTAFRLAYDRDQNAASEALRQQLAYYFQSGSAGRQEAFAEAFALVLGGGADQENADPFRRAFPHTLRYLNQHIQHFEAMPTARATSARWRIRR